MTPQTFIAKWGPGGPAFELNEEQGAQSHFLDLCDLLDVPKPGSEAGYRFEEKSAVIGGRTGYADVFKSATFAWENKAPGKNLIDALRQLQNYSLALNNPPILVVCDRLVIRVYSQFNGHPTETFDTLLAELDQPEKLARLRRIWLDPESFRPKKTSRDITEAAAKSFATLADSLRRNYKPTAGTPGAGPSIALGPASPHFQAHADDVAHFLTQCLFCFFAEDVGLLPGRMFEGLVNNRRFTSDKFTLALGNLFTAMRDGGLYGNDDIPWFNGGLFKRIAVPPLSVLEMTELRNAAALNWSAIDVSIFGTLFERGLDPSKRSQLGAHYTDPATIMRIIEPVLQRPLLLVWEHCRQQIQGLQAKSKRKGDKNNLLARAAFIGWLDQLKAFRVLDPACGSGNFLFLGLKALKDIELASHLEAAALGLDREADLVTGPHNLLGIELNEYAAELARVTVWIGELQWRLTHGFDFKTNPVLEPLDHIECRDALIEWVPAPPGQGSGADLPAPRAVEAAWPWASVVVGNPPFLGDKKMRSELGDEYTEALRQAYDGRVGGGADLVTYWFEKARGAIDNQGLGAAGLVATQSVRAGANRAVLTRIGKTTRIFEAWSDMPWVNEGAAVRVSLVCFGWGGNGVILDGQHVPCITSDLADGATVDLTVASRLLANKGRCFVGSQKGGDFEVSGALAREWLRQPSVNGRSNSEVLRPWANGQDLTGRGNDQWIVDFGNDMSEVDASQFDLPFRHVVLTVKVVRGPNREAASGRYWWLHQRPRPEMRAAIGDMGRYIATPRVAKHRFFVFLEKHTLADSRLCAIASADDTTFGILSSRLHEVWSLANASMHGVGNDQTTETLPGGEIIPAGLPGPSIEAILASNQPLAHVFTTGAAINKGVKVSDVRTHATRIAQAAYRLNALREAWLNPPEWTQRLPEVIPLGMASSPYPDRIVARPGHDKDLAERTLTKLYNKRPAWLAAAHHTLDAAGAAAYGWVDYSADMADDELLKRLLALNLARAVR